MIALDEALALMRAVIVPLGGEEVPLATAGGRTLARPLVSRIDAPRHDVSAMDGYAMRAADLAEYGHVLRVVGRSWAGAGYPHGLGPGEAARIFTGAPLPAGADKVVIQERARRDGDLVHLEEPVSSSRNVRERASDFAAGDVLLEQSRRLDPRAMVAAAAADQASVFVTRVPRVAIVSTGDELTAPGEAHGDPDRIPESVSLGVAALVGEWGGEVVRTARLPDDVERMQASAPALVADADIVVVTGGASVGERDYAKAIFEPMGLEQIFSKVAIKPGKPVWLGRLGAAHVLGLPGNPTSAMVVGRLFLPSLISLLLGGKLDACLDWRQLPLAAPLGPAGDRETFVRAQWRDGGLHPLANRDTSAQRTLAAADMLIRRPAGEPAVASGQGVPALQF